LAYDQLDLVTFYTVKGVETRAWAVPRGTLAPQAAGKIHQDMERGFIRAEVVDWESFVRCGSLATAREQGILRSEGKDYAIQDGDVVLFRFNVLSSTGKWYDVHVCLSLHQGGAWGRHVQGEEVSRR